MFELEEQWSRSARVISLYTSLLAITAQAIVMGFFYMYWVVLVGLVFFVSEAIRAAAKSKKPADVDRMEFIYLLWALSAAHPRPTHGVVCLALVLLLSFMPKRYIREACFGTVVTLGLLAMMPAASIYNVLGTGPSWMPWAYAVSCCLAATSFFCYCLIPQPLDPDPKGDT